MKRRRVGSIGAGRAFCVALLFVSTLVVGPTLGCATRTSNDRIINQYGLDIYLRSEKKTFGKAIDRDFEHPAEISPERLESILAAIEVEVKGDGSAYFIQPAIAPEILRDIALGVAQAYLRADSSQEIAVMSQRKQMQKFVFNRKFLTSFVTYLEDGRLYVWMSRVDWKMDEDQRHKEWKPPMPHIEDPQTKFRMVTNEAFQDAGRGGVSVDWNDPMFGNINPQKQRRPATRKTILSD